jgi:hypothetical protein
MATTTNYGWTTPDDTALVKDGASAIRTLGSSVDTTTKALNPSTTLGDIEYRSSTANTNTRLGIGTTGQVLSVSGGVPAWTTSSSGGMTLLSTTSLSGTTTTVSSIDQTYTNLLIIVQDPSLAVGTGGRLRVSIGNIQSISINSSTASAGNVTTIEPPGDIAVAATSSSLSVLVNLYANATTFKNFIAYGATNNTTVDSYFSAGITTATTAISSISVTTSGGTRSFDAGQILIYGVK